MVNNQPSNTSKTKGIGTMLDQDVFLAAHQLHILKELLPTTEEAGVKASADAALSSNHDTKGKRSLTTKWRQAASANVTSSERILALNWRCEADPQAGGSELNLFRQAEHWAAAGHAVTVFTAHPGREDGSGFLDEKNGIHIIHVGSRFSVYLYAAVYLFFFAFLYDQILDISNGIPFFSPIFTKKPITLLVHHVHGDQWYEEFPNPIARFGWFLESRVVPWLYRNHQVIVVSPTTYDAMLQIGYKADQMSIVYNGLDMPEHQPTLDNRQPRIAYVGRLKAYKRINLLIEAVAQLRLTQPDVHLDIAGKGDVEEELMQLVANKQLQGHVTFHGFISDQKRQQILQSAAVFATASMHEGWGLSVLEANANGCPAVAYDVPGLSVSIRDRITGLLSADEPAFVENLASVISDHALWRNLSSGALEWASEFDWGKSAAMTLQVMKQRPLPANRWFSGGNVYAGQRL
jgi:glycosyltransferase involved in cell wall biosynthesis